jgi:hypothetical protein
MFAYYNNGVSQYLQETSFFLYSIYNQVGLDF